MAGRKFPSEPEKAETAVAVPPADFFFITQNDETYKSEIMHLSRVIIIIHE